ncbi:MAG: gluconate transporter, partial [Acidimicrobiales bacterium]
EPTALIILVTGAGGAFKQVLTDSGAGNDLAALLFGTGITPVILGFVLALVFRLLQGSATVAMTAAAGLMASLIGVGEFTQWQLAILTISIAAGASGFSHVNDSGFWLVNRLFDLTEKETLRTWTLMTGLLSVSALAMCVVLYGFTG